MRLPAGRTLLFLLALLFSSALPAYAQNGGVTGTVRDVATSTPLRGIRVEAVSATGRVGATAVTAENGTYTLRDLPPGNYALVISGTDVPVRRLDVEVTA
ncbi:MAG: carboxypeptidase-like regulatory domain-containing protein, partial [Gemmatimonadetes bacterium]|nr:carboxypeptidase-like regulatory domain-containing protein [Gemmatimonadota bacterium]